MSSTSNSSQAWGTGSSAGHSAVPKHDSAAWASGQTANVLAPFTSTVCRYSPSSTLNRMPSASSYSRRDSATLGVIGPKPAMKSTFIESVPPGRAKTQLSGLSPRGQDLPAATLGSGEDQAPGRPGPGGLGAAGRERPPRLVLPAHLGGVLRARRKRALAGHARRDRRGVRGAGDVGAAVIEAAHALSFRPRPRGSAGARAALGAEPRAGRNPGVALLDRRRPRCEPARERGRRHPGGACFGGRPGGAGRPGAPARDRSAGNPRSHAGAACRLPEVLRPGGVPGLPGLAVLLLHGDALGRQRRGVGTPDRLRQPTGDVGPRRRRSGDRPARLRRRSAGGLVPLRRIDGPGRGGAPLP